MYQNPNYSLRYIVEESGRALVVHNTMESDSGKVRVKRDDDLQNTEILLEVEG